jgi:hypothetical protein
MRPPVGGVAAFWLTSLLLQIHNEFADAAGRHPGPPPLNLVGLLCNTGNPLLQGAAYCAA